MKLIAYRAFGLYETQRRCAFCTNQAKGYAFTQAQTGEVNESSKIPVCLEHAPSKQIESGTLSELENLDGTSQSTQSNA